MFVEWIDGEGDIFGSESIQKEHLGSECYPSGELWLNGNEREGEGERDETKPANSLLSAGKLLP
jgi:hypothetical protein